MTPAVKIRMRRGFWRWECSCGRKGKRGYGLVGLAELYGRHHLKGKHGC